ncbi:HEAT repeat domain-containing protein [Bacteriovoracaceae bacterium]|nr:HEAT repeat domain-containing protein [Bacteriovoracaceae bacterium]
MINILTFRKQSIFCFLLFSSISNSYSASDFLKLKTTGGILQQIGSYLTVEEHRNLLEASSGMKEHRTDLKSSDSHKAKEYLNEQVCYNKRRNLVSETLQKVRSLTHNGALFQYRENYQISNRDPIVIDMLIREMLHHYPGEDVRRRAAIIVSKIDPNNEAVLNALTEALNGDKNHIAERAVDALLLIRPTDPKILGPLAEALKEDKHNIKIFNDETLQSFIDLAGTITDQ